MILGLKGIRCLRCFVLWLRSPDRGCSRLASAAEVSFGSTRPLASPQLTSFAQSINDPTTMTTVGVHVCCRAACMHACMHADPYGCLPADRSECLHARPLRWTPEPPLRSLRSPLACSDARWMEETNGPSVRPSSDLLWAFFLGFLSATSSQWRHLEVGRKSRTTSTSAMRKQAMKKDPNE